MTTTANPDAAPMEDTFVISRLLRAPRAMVWQAATERERLMQWFGPKGFTTPQCELDLRPGGHYHYCLRAANGFELWGKWVFREITAPERLVFLSSFSDPEGKVQPNPFSPVWPLEILSTLIFEEQEGGTLMTVRWTPWKASEAERLAFLAGVPSMNQGWSGTLDRFEEYLAGQ